ncbi:MAG: hypothetical protein LBH58_05430 [Tannerellaceae bacterium]|jgi:hypothetical protein|nr:hypothetical protein [Tannerellaceae bacterium]
MQDEKKFPNSNPIRPLKGLTYFQDINLQEPVQLINGTLKWKKIEQRLQDMTKKQGSVFPELGS